jgi:hypothetical protein
MCVRGENSRVLPSNQIIWAGATRNVCDYKAHASVMVANSIRVNRCVGRVVCDWMFIDIIWPSMLVVLYVVGAMPGGGDVSLILASLTNLSSERDAESHPALHCTAG